jgi:tRNA pseudouridine38-40 synthase
VLIVPLFNQAQSIKFNQSSSTNQRSAQTRNSLMTNDQPHPSLRRIALLVEYDGTQFAGWQRQANALTVQEVLERVLERLTGQFCTVHGSGRTDAGVHGYGQVAHVDIPASWSTPADKIPDALNGHLLSALSAFSAFSAPNSFIPNSFVPSVRIRAASDTAGATFHARFDAIRREYRYRVVTQESVAAARMAWCLRPAQRRVFTPELLHECSQIFLGTHDFTSFSKHNPDTKNYVCTVEQACWRERADLHYGERERVWEFTISADRFVYGMVRSLVGAMMDVAFGKRSTDELRSALQAADRTLKSPLAPPQGLTLWRVDYPQNPFSSFV